MLDYFKQSQNMSFRVFWAICFWCAHGTSSLRILPCCPQASLMLQRRAQHLRQAGSAEDFGTRTACTDSMLRHFTGSWGKNILTGGKKIDCYHTTTLSKNQFIHSLVSIHQLSSSLFCRTIIFITVTFFGSRA